VELEAAHLLVPSPPVTLHTLLGGWQTDWLTLGAVALTGGVGALYLAGARRLHGRGRRWSRWRTAAFLSGLAVVVVAIDSGVAAYDDSVFVMHVVQHLLLMNLAPILLALGAPVTLALQASHRPTQVALLKVLHSRPLAVLTHPILVAIGFYVTMVAYFLTGLYALSLRHPLFHDYTHLHFLASGCLFWWAVVGLDPVRWKLPFPARLAMLAPGVPVSAVLGVALTSMTGPLAPEHTLMDTHAGGAVLWGIGELFTLAALMLVGYQWMRAEERKAARGDRSSDARAGHVLVPAVVGGRFAWVLPEELAKLPDERAEPAQEPAGRSEELAGQPPEGPARQGDRALPGSCEPGPDAAVSSDPAGRRP
jgi:putative membrane protein